MEANKSLKPRAILGVILILIGGLYFLENLNIIPARVSDVILSWPLLFIIIGSFILFNSRKKFIGMVFLIIGLLNFFPKIFPSFNIDHDLILPLLVIFFGIFLITRNRKSRDFENRMFNHVDADRNINKLEDVSIFGGGERIFHSDNFQGGNITAIFGGSKIDLSDCKMQEGHHYLDVTIIFGGTTLIVPDNWKVQVDVLPLFGGFSNRQVRNPDHFVDGNATLHIKGVVVFGGGDVKVRLFQ